MLGKPTARPARDLVYVFVRLGSAYGTDEFFIVDWEVLQHAVVEHHRQFLQNHGGTRPKKPDSFHAALKPANLAKYKDNWQLVTKRLTP